MICGASGAADADADGDGGGGGGGAVGSICKGPGGGAGVGSAVGSDVAHSLRAISAVIRARKRFSFADGGALIGVLAMVGDDRV